MNSARQFACAAILALLLLPALPQDSVAQGSVSATQDGRAQEAPAGLCPSEPIWGLPPADDAIHIPPPLPALQGTCRYLPPGYCWGLNAALDGKVVLDRGRSVAELVDGRNGKSMWQAELGWPASIQLGWEHLFAVSADSGDMVALKLTDGTLEWTATDCYPIGISSRGVWAAYLDHANNRGQNPSALLQLEQRSGAVLKVNPLHGNVTFSSVEELGGAYLQCLMGDHLLITGGPMILETRMDLNNAEGWEGACAGMSRTSHFVLHYRSEPSSSATERLHTKLCCYDGAGSLVWSKEQSIAGSMTPEKLVCIGDIVLVSTAMSYGSLFFSATDGSFLNASSLIQAKVVLGESAEEDRLYLLDNKMPYERTQIYFYDPRQLQAIPVPGTEDLNITDYFGNHDMLFLLHGNDFSAAWGNPGRALYALPLERGEPVAGELLAVSFPADHTQLLSDFSASLNPLQDKDLMSAIVKGGLTVVSGLIEAEGNEQSEHLDALAALVCYYEANAPKVDDRREASALFTSRVRDLAAPTLLEPISRWLDDDSLQLLHHELLGILALCGSEAEPVLEAQYVKRYPQDYVPASPPYQPASTELIRGHAGEIFANWSDAYREDAVSEYAADFTEARVTAADGTVYVLYNSHGLQCPYDLYISVDSRGDGTVDEILATGLIGLPPAILKRLQVESNSQPPLELEFDGEKLKLSFWQPQFALKDVSSLYEEMEPFPVLSSASWSHKLVSLAELRQDSDADGFTDMEEDLLLTDKLSIDSDADGIADKQDPCPLAAAADMGIEERGASRALAYLFDHYLLYNQVHGQRHPARAMFLRVEGLGALEFSTPFAVQAISLHDDEKTARFLGEGGIGSNSALLLMSWKRPGEKTSSFGPGDGEDGYCLEFWDSGNFVTIILKDVGGELYPVYLWGNYGIQVSEWSLL